MAVDEKALREQLAEARAEIEALREQLVEARAEASALRDLLRQAPVPISILRGADHIMEFANAVNLQMLGKTEAEVMGQSLRKTFPSEQGYAGLFKLLDEVFQTGMMFRSESPPAPFDRNGTGVLVPTVFNLLYYPWKNAQGQIMGVMVIGIDITEQVEARQRMEQLNEELEIRVAQRTREIEELNARIIEAQREALRELSTPLIPIADNVVIMPLIGTIDSRRAQEVMETLLEGVSHYQAELAILDITGIKVVDTQVAQVLIRVAQAVKLLGSQVMLTGIQPQIARTMVHLGVNLDDILTRRTLQTGVASALKNGY